MKKWEYCILILDEIRSTLLGSTYDSYLVYFKTPRPETEIIADSSDLIALSEEKLIYPSAEELRQDYQLKIVELGLEGWEMFGIEKWEANSPEEGLATRVRSTTHWFKRPIEG